MTGYNNKKSNETNKTEIPKLQFRSGESKKNNCKTIIDISNLSKEQILNKAIKFHSQGNISEARKCYQYLINEAYMNPIVFSNYGIILQELGKLKEAELAQRKAIEIEPNFENAYSNLGVILRDLGKLKDAENSQRKAIQINPNFANAHLNLGIILRDVGKLKEAEYHQNKAININPNCEIANSSMGLILRDIGKLKEAEVYQRKAIKINPNFAEAYLNLGNIYRDFGKLKDAEKLIRKAIIIKPNLPEGHFNLGTICRDLGKLKEAEISLKRAIELNVKIKDVHNNLGLILGDLGKTNESVLSFKLGIKNNPSNPLQYENLALTLRDYIWKTQNNLIQRIESIDNLIDLEKAKLKIKLNKEAIWFTDITRTSSTTIQFMMWDKLGWPFGKGSKLVKDSLVHQRSPILPNHTPAIITKNLIGEEIWRKLETFTIVRNPYDWCISLWKTEIKVYPALRDKSFLKYLTYLEENLENDFTTRKIRPSTLRQTDYLLDNNDNIIVNKILKFEDRETIEAYLKKHNFSYKSDVHLHKSKTNNYQLSIYERKIIERIFAKDFELLGYSLFIK